MSETCQICGKQYDTVYRVPDEVWEIIKPAGKPEGAGLLCLPCAFKQAKAHGIELEWAADTPRPAIYICSPDVLWELGPLRVEYHSYLGPSFWVGEHACFPRRWSLWWVVWDLVKGRVDR